MKPIEERLAQVVICNMTGCSSYMNSGALIGRAVKVEVIEESESAVNDPGGTLVGEEQTKDTPLVQNIKSVDDRKEELRRWVGIPKLLSTGIAGSYHSSSCSLLFG